MIDVQKKRGTSIFYMKNNVGQLATLDSGFNRFSVYEYKRSAHTITNPHELQGGSLGGGRRFWGASNKTYDGMQMIFLNSHVNGSRDVKLC